MIALPGAPGAAGTALIVIGAVLGVLVFVAAFRRFTPLALPAGRAGMVATGISSLALATALAGAPYLCWRIVQDVRYTRGISEFVAERIGAYEYDLEGSAFDRLAARLPEQTTYFVDPGHTTGSGNFAEWARTALLPRIPVGTPQAAQWVVTLGVDPRTLGVELEDVQTVPTSYGPDATIYLGRVAR